MADANFEGFVAGDGMSRSRAGGLMNVIGAVTTLALVVGVGVWGYQLAVRDASGVPVLQAMEGPIRVASDDPGGTVARHVGLSVNRIAAEGTVGDVPEEIILAEPPLELAEDDTPGIGAAAPSQIVDADTKARTLAMAEELANSAPPVVVPIGSAVADAVADVALEEDADPLASAIAAAVADVVGGAGDGQRSSIRPQPRPRGLMAASAATPDPFVAAVASSAPLSATPAAAPMVSALTSVSSLGSEELATSELRPGMRLAQIGAFEDAESARAEWGRVAARHPTLFEGKARIIQQASSVGRTFYRLRVAGFESEDDSRRFCSAISSGDLRCITVTTR